MNHENAHGPFHGAQGRCQQHMDRAEIARVREQPGEARRVGPHGAQICGIVVEAWMQDGRGAS